MPIAGVAAAANPLEEEAEAAPAVDLVAEAELVLLGPVPAPAAPSSDASAFVASGKSVAVVLYSP